MTLTARQRIAAALQTADYRPGRLTDNAVTILNRRYLKKDADGNPIELPDAMFRRGAHDLAQAEANADDQRLYEEKFYDLMASGRFLPNSPMLMNAGRDLQQLSACFVLPVQDSLDSIFQSVKETALIHKSGGGTGFDFSAIRPAGDRVGPAQGVASGAVSFIEPFDHATEVIKQGGTRRGANMAILRCDHPEISTFIEYKRDGRRLKNFNVSVAATEAFMQAATRTDGNNDFTLLHPVTDRPAGVINARDTLQLIAQCAWESGDPGLVFLHRLNADNTNPHLGEIASTNPCVAGDTWVMTAAGPRRIAALADDTAPRAEFDVRVSAADYPATAVATGFGPLLEIIAEPGYRLKATPDHRILTADGWTAAGDLSPGAAIILNDHRGNTEWGDSATDQQAAIAWILGSFTAGGEWPCDGTPPTITAVNPQHRCEANQKAQQAGWGPAQWTHPDDSSIAYQAVIPVAPLQDYGFAPGLCAIPDQVEAASSEFYSEFLAGFISRSRAAASENPERTLCHHPESSVLQTIQRMLLRKGILSTINAPANCLAIPSVPLNGTAIVSHQPGAAAPTSAPETRYHATVKTVRSAADGELYDIKAPAIRAFDANGFYVHNCGEQPLLPYESCNLGSVNLAAMLRYEPATRQYEWDWPALTETIATAVRLLDNVIDRNNWPIPQIRDASLASRRIGLGVMGWADALVMLGIPYDSAAACQAADAFMSQFRALTHQASSQLAAERGAYPAWAGSVYQKQDRPMRNTAPVTIAPTGTISTIAGASSGIEPYFALAYRRDVLDDAHLYEYNELFRAVLAADGCDRPEILEQVGKTGSVANTDLPQWIKDVFRTSHEISPAAHVAAQAAFQQHTDNAVSKTINMPRHATPDDVRDAYIQAWQTGCKGITIYRDGSKDSQVLNIGSAEPQDPAPAGAGAFQPRVRPRRLTGDTHRFRTGHGNIYVTVNTDADGRPFEVFTQVGKAGGCDSANLEAVSRLASLALRLGAPAGVVIDQLQNITCCPAYDEGRLVRSVPDAIAHALAGDPGRDHPNPAPPAAGRRPPACPECGGDTFMAEGCQNCAGCGWSRCE